MFGPFRGEGSRSLNELQDEMNRVIKRFWHTGISIGPLDGQECAPPWDVYEDAERYIACVELPGMGSDDFDVTYAGHTLTISGNKSAASPDSATTCLRSERRFGSFSRSIHLPEPVEADGITATCANGLLTVTLHKKADPTRRTVKVDIS